MNIDNGLLPSASLLEGGGGGGGAGRETVLLIFQPSHFIVYLL